MSTSHQRSHSSHQKPTSNLPSPTYFEQQRAELLTEISMSFEQVLQNINRLNRNLESIITVGNEFSAAEALWSQFENVTGRNGEEHEADGGNRQGESGSGGGGERKEGRHVDDEVKHEDDDEEEGRRS